MSPVATVLDALDAFVESADEQTIYPLIGLGYKLPPDGALTLNQPLQLGNATRWNQVFEFEGEAGQEVVGQSEGGPKYEDGYGFWVSGELYTADGEPAGYVAFLPKGANECCAYPQELPATGSYRLVIFGPLPPGMTLTLFDKEHAPKELLQNDGFTEGPGTSEECNVDSDGVVGCSSHGSGTAVGATPTTMVAKPREVTATTSP